MIILNYRSIFDKISALASIACAVHCVVLPVFFSSLPFLGIEILENFFIELLTVAISLVIGGWAIFSGYLKHHSNKNIVLLFLAGVIILLISNFITNEGLEITAKIVGAIVLIVAHVKNWKQCKTCSNN
jgi:drug/metabolite transporter (DMT)-like permease